MANNLVNRALAIFVVGMKRDVHMLRQLPTDFLTYSPRFVNTGLHFSKNCFHKIELIYDVRSYKPGPNISYYLSRPN